MGTEPVRCGHGQRVQRRAHALDRAIEAVERPHRAQHVGGARRAGGRACAAVHAPGRARARCRRAAPRPRRPPAECLSSLSTEASKPGSVNSRPRRYFQSMRPRTASAARRSERSGAELQQRHEREPPRALGRPPAGGEQALELLILEDWAERVAQDEAVVPLRKGGAGHGRGRGRHLAAGSWTKRHDGPPGSRRSCAPPPERSTAANRLKPVRQQYPNQGRISRCRRRAETPAAGTPLPDRYGQGPAGLGVG